MNIDRYIALSIVVHLLFLGYFGLTHSTEDAPKVFDVKIVSPADVMKDPVTEREEIIPKERAVEKEPVPEKKPVIVRRRRRPVDIDNSVKPQVIFGEGLGEAKKEDRDFAKKEDSDRMKGLDSGSAEKEAVPSGIRGSDPVDSDRPALSPGDILFDKKTIEKYASRGTQEGGGSQDGTGFMFYAPEFKNRAYMRMLRDRIESIWKYPNEAAQRRLTGDLFIKFVIKKNGKLDRVELVRTSGYRELDDAAIQALKKADPYWPLPDNYEKDVLEITGHFIYVLGSPYVM